MRIMIFLSLTIIFITHALTQQINVNIKYSKDTAWFQVCEWGVEGKGWNDVQRYYDRLPYKAEKIVRKEVWDLSRQSAGMSARFITDASSIFVRYKLYKSGLEMVHMPATGVSGVDLYVQTPDNNWKWVAVSKPAAQNVYGCLIKNLIPGKKEYLLYLPLYNGIDSLEIGVLKNSVFEPVLPRKERPIVFYGTSIMQGGCASRPGMAFTAILERKLNKPIINLGFSGNGRMDSEIGTLLSELDAEIFVIDCLPNMTAQQVKERTKPFVMNIRKKKSETPILLVEDRDIQGFAFTLGLDTLHAKKRLALKNAYNELINEGIKNIFYLEGENLLGRDGEATVDGSHPTDLGMMRYADLYEPILREILHIK